MHAASVRVDGDRLRRQDREDASDSAHVGPHLEHSPGGITAAFEDWAQTSFAHGAQTETVACQRLRLCDHAGVGDISPRARRELRLSLNLLAWLSSKGRRDFAVVSEDRARTGSKTRNRLPRAKSCQTTKGPACPAPSFSCPARVQSERPHLSGILQADYFAAESGI